MAFIDDNQIKVTDAHFPFTTIQYVAHSVIGGEYNRGVVISLFLCFLGKNGARRMRKKFLESSLGLRYKSGSVGQEQDTFGPAVSLQNINDRDGTSRLSRPGRHDQQGFSLLIVECFRN